MKKKQIKERIEYLESEIAHAGYHDGWVLKGMREELAWLRKEMNGEG